MATTDTPARVIANDLSENAVAVYYFNNYQNNGRVTDSSGNGLTGHLFNNAKIATISDRKCLSMRTNAAHFQVWDDDKPLNVNKEFSLVAWVKIPQQLNYFWIQVAAYDHYIEWSEFRGAIDLSIGIDGELRGYYYYNTESEHDNFVIFSFPHAETSESVVCFSAKCWKSRYHEA